MSYCRYQRFSLSLHENGNIMKAIGYMHFITKPAEQIGLHVQPTWELSYVIRGTGIRFMGSQQEPFQMGEVVLVPPNLKHCWTFAGDDPIECITLYFDPDVLSRLNSLFPEFETVTSRFLEYSEAICFKGSTLHRLQSSLKRIENENDTERIVSLLGIIVDIAQSSELKFVGRQRTDTEIKLEKIKIYIGCNYNHDICINSIAKYMGMNRSSLCTFFHQQTGQTIIEAINACKLSMASQLLSHKDLTIQQICFESGFNNLSYFFRFFKSTMGMTPNEYRKLLQSGA